LGDDRHQFNFSKRRQRIDPASQEKHQKEALAALIVAIEKGRESLGRGGGAAK
jgi:hypothetical protein